MKIGIFFGGPAREREISFLGGKTVFTHLDKALFEPVPVFIDGTGRFILLRPEWMAQESIRDFYPPREFVRTEGYPFTVYAESLDLTEDEEVALISAVGQEIYPQEFRDLFDFAFLVVHGPQLEDGALQGLLEWYGVPYYGSGVMGSGIGIDKIAQNRLIERTVGLNKAMAVITRDQWQAETSEALFARIKTEVGVPFVVKAPHQGSSIGVAFVKHDDLAEFEQAVKTCLFIREITAAEWRGTSDEAKGTLLQKLANFDEGIAFPLVFGDEEIRHPQALWTRLNAHFDASDAPAVLTSVHAEDAVLCEAFVRGQEFSCGVIQDFDGTPLALPPTEIVKETETTVFDFNTKYKTDTVRKNIPIQAPLEHNQRVQARVRDAFGYLGFGVCTRIDGFLTPEGDVLLHDPNTLPGMSPVSLIFKQMAHIGLNVTDSLTYFIRFSLRERIRTGKQTARLARQLAALDGALRVAQGTRRRVALVLPDGEAAFASARQAYARLAASAEYEPVPLIAGAEGYRVVSTAALLQPTFEAVRLVSEEVPHPLIAETRARTGAITAFITGPRLAAGTFVTDLAAVAPLRWTEDALIRL
jgi:D-alanine-D-alanine ligase